jgi:hypothetical protein
VLAPGTQDALRAEAMSVTTGTLDVDRTPRIPL